MKPHDCWDDPIIVRHERASETTTLHYCRSCGRVTSVSFEQRPLYIMRVPTIRSQEEADAYLEQARLIGSFYRRSYDGTRIPLEAAWEALFGPTASSAPNETENSAIGLRAMELTSEAADEIERRLKQPEAMPTREPQSVTLDPWFREITDPRQCGVCGEIHAPGDPFEPYAGFGWKVDDADHGEEMSIDDDLMDGDGMDDVHRTMRIWNEAGERAERHS